MRKLFTTHDNINIRQFPGIFFASFVPRINVSAYEFGMLFVFSSHHTFYMQLTINCVLRLTPMRMEANSQNTALTVERLNMKTMTNSSGIFPVWIYRRYIPKNWHSFIKFYRHQNIYTFNMLSIQIRTNSKTVKHEKHFIQCKSLEATVLFFRLQCGMDLISYNTLIQWWWDRRKKRERQKEQQQQLQSLYEIRLSGHFTNLCLFVVCYAHYFGHSITINWNKNRGKKVLRFTV